MRRFGILCKRDTACRRLEQTHARNGHRRTGPPRFSLTVFTRVATAVIRTALLLCDALNARRPGSPCFGVYESGAAAGLVLSRPAPVSDFQVVAFFVIFDIEAAFLFARALNVRGVGWTGLVSASIFIGVLLAALAYLWADGALEAGPAGRTSARKGRRLVDWRVGDLLPRIC